MSDAAPAATPAPAIAAGKKKPRARTNPLKIKITNRDYMQETHKRATIGGKFVYLRVSKQTNGGWVRTTEAAWRAWKKSHGQPVSVKKAAPKKKSAPKRKSAPKKKSAPKRKAPAKKKSAPKRKAPAKKKSAPKRARK